MAWTSPSSMFTREDLPQACRPDFVKSPSQRLWSCGTDRAGTHSFLHTSQLQMTLCIHTSQLHMAVYILHHYTQLFAYFTTTHSSLHTSPLHTALYILHHYTQLFAYFTTTHSSLNTSPLQTALCIECYNPKKKKPMRCTILIYFLFLQASILTHTLIHRAHSYS